MDREIYLDNAATTRAYDEVISYMNDINIKYYGNPSSMHTKGIEAEKLLKLARERIAGSMGAVPGEIYFTSGGTEANNMAIFGYLEANRHSGKHIITTAVEHPSVLEVYKYLSKKGYTVDFINPDSQGIIDLNMLESKITSETALISLLYVNNETGAVQPVQEVVEIKNRLNRNAAIHMDAVQAYGKIRINPGKSGIDLMSVSSHKIHGPKGCGALFVRNGIKLQSILFGGGQENKLRSGTENVPGISGFGLASEITFRNINENSQKLSALKSRFIELLEEKIQDYRVISNENSSPYILNVAFKNLKAEVLLHHLEERGIFVSTGSACSSRRNTSSHVLKAMAVEPCYIDGAIRFSFSSFTSIEDIEYTVSALVDIIPRIRYGGKK
ncbi:MAG: cysteine desulfurase family protein [Bacillota bacterium]|nr:cysteine desulfurase family protein [Bacillota bacterium]